MEREFDIMVAGHLCIDFTPHIPDTGAERISDILSPGKLVDVGSCVVATGGSVSNTGFTLKKLGAKVCFSACIGDDQFGSIVKKILEGGGNTSGISVNRNYETSYSVVIAAPRIDRIFLHNPGANNEFCAKDLDLELIKRCRHFHFGYPPLMAGMFKNRGDELVKIFKAAKLAGASTSLDMALPDPDSPAGKADWREILEKTLPFVDIFLPSFEEAFFMLERKKFLEMKKMHGNAELIHFAVPEDYSRISGEILSLGARMTSLKAGARGFYFRTGSREKLKELEPLLGKNMDNWVERELWCPCYKIDKIASATGSGDCSIAGFLKSVISGMTVEESLLCAVCLGWQNLHAMDSLSGVKSWEETLTTVRDGKLPILDIENKSPLWKQLDGRGFWSGPNDRMKPV